MKLSEVKEMSNEQLIIHFHTITVRSVHEVNSRRGLSQKTIKDEEMLVDEMVERFGLNGEEVTTGINW